MNRKEVFWQIILPLLYVGLAAGLFITHQVGPLLLIAIPWSIPLMILSWLIYHVAVDGQQIMTVGSLVGVLLNALIYCYDVRRRRLMRQSVANPQSS